MPDQKTTQAAAGNAGPSGDYRNAESPDQGADIARAGALKPRIPALKADFNATGIVFNSNTPTVPYDEVLLGAFQNPETLLTMPHLKDKRITLDDLLKGAVDFDDILPGGRMRRGHSGQAEMLGAGKSRKQRDDFLLQQALEEFHRLRRLAQESYERAQYHLDQAREFTRRAHKELERAQDAAERQKEIEKDAAERGKSIRDLAREALGDDLFEQVKGDENALLAALSSRPDLDPDLAAWVQARRDQMDALDLARQHNQQARTHREEANRHQQQAEELVKDTRNFGRDHNIETLDLPDSDNLRRDINDVDANINQVANLIEKQQAARDQQYRAAMNGNAAAPANAKDDAALGDLLEETGAPEKSAASAPRPNAAPDEDAALAALGLIEDPAGTAAADEMQMPKTISVYGSEDEFLTTFQKRISGEAVASATPVDTATGPSTTDSDHQGPRLSTTFARAHDHVQEDPAAAPELENNPRPAIDMRLA